MYLLQWTLVHVPFTKFLCNNDNCSLSVIEIFLRRYKTTFSLAVLPDVLTRGVQTVFFMTNQNWQFSIPSEALLTFDLTWPAPIKMLMVLLDTWAEIDGVRGVIPI